MAMISCHDRFSFKGNAAILLFFVSRLVLNGLTSFAIPVEILEYVSINRILPIIQ